MLLDIDQKWRKKEDGTMELIEEKQVERREEINYSVEEYLLNLDYRVSKIELGV